MATFPFATKTFTVKRNVVQVVNGNPTPQGVQSIATGVSILIKQKNGLIIGGQGATESVGNYDGATFYNQDIQAGDILEDEVETTSTGKPVAYEVHQTTVYAPLYLDLTLYRRQTK